MSEDPKIYERFQVIVLETPYESLQNPKAQALFPQIMELKKRGYQKEYGKYVLPFDTSDFIANHIVLCEKNQECFNPVMGFKSVTLSQCDEYRVNFPMLGMLECSRGDNALSKKKIKSILNEYREKNLSHKLAYNGSYTVAPHLRDDKELMKEIWSLTFSMITNYYMTYSIDHVLAVCTTTFKVDQRKEKLGWNYIKSCSGTLPVYSCQVLNDSPFIPMELKDVKEKSLIPSSLYKKMWQDRVTIKTPDRKRAVEEAA